MKVTVGQVAPPFCLPDGDGQSVCLKNFIGKWVVLYFYPKDNTPGCTLEAIDFSVRISEFAMQGTIVFGISPDSRESHCRFRDKHDLKVLLLSDVEHRVLETYGVWVQKKQAGKSHFGVERTTVLIGPDGMVRYIWNNVKVPGHIESVLEKIKAMRN